MDKKENKIKVFETFAGTVERRGEAVLQHQNAGANETGMKNLTPHFQDDTNTFYKDDCLEVMKEMPDNSVDLVLTDPPYALDIQGEERCGGAGVAKNKLYDLSDWDKEIPQRAVFENIVRISKKVIIFGGNYFTDMLPQSNRWLVWDKNRPDGVSFSGAELIYTRGIDNRNGVDIVKFTWHGMIQEDMKNKEKRYHPTQKPTQLVSLLLERYTKEGDVVLDCFLGSGTTAVACKGLGRKCIGIELSKEYCDIAVERYKAEKQQTKLL